MKKCVVFVYILLWIASTKQLKIKEKRKSLKKILLKSPHKNKQMFSRNERSYATFKIMTTKYVMYSNCFVICPYILIRCPTFYIRLRNVFLARRKKIEETNSNTMEKQQEEILPQNQSNKAQTGSLILA